MGYYTNVLAAAGCNTTPEIEGVIERERDQRREPDRAQIFDFASEIMRRAELQGFIAPKG